MGLNMVSHWRFYLDTSSQATDTIMLVYFILVHAAIKKLYLVQERLQKCQLVCIFVKIYGRVLKISNISSRNLFNIVTSANFSLTFVFSLYYAYIKKRDLNTRHSKYWREVWLPPSGVTLFKPPLTRFMTSSLPCSCRIVSRLKKLLRL